MEPKSFGPGGPDAAGRHEILKTEGPTLDVIVHQVAGLVIEDEAPSFHPTRALIDTGASGVCIDYRIAHALRLREVDQCTIVVVGSSIPAAIFMGELEVPALGYRRTIPMIASKVGRINYNVLLGRSFLSDYIVTFDGPAGYFHFATPQQSLLAPPDEDG